MKLYSFQVYYSCKNLSIHPTHTVCCIYVWWSVFWFVPKVFSRVEVLWGFCAGHLEFFHANRRLHGHHFYLFIYLDYNLLAGFVLQAKFKVWYFLSTHINQWSMISTFYKTLLFIWVQRDEVKKKKNKKRQQQQNRIEFPNPGPGTSCSVPVFSLLHHTWWNSSANYHPFLSQSWWKAHQYARQGALQDQGWEHVCDLHCCQFNYICTK